MTAPDTPLRADIVRPDVTLRDVTPRDGLQSERVVDPAQRARLARDLSAAGLGHVEVASFVSPRAVPAMADAASVVDELRSTPASDAEPTTWWALVPNARGAELATAAGVDHVTVTVSASNGYSEKNIGRSAAEAIAALGGVASALPADAVIDVVMSCAFGSPFHDVAGPAEVVAVVAAIREHLPVAWITLADTTGTATPRRLADVLRALDGEIPPATLTRLGLHLHDTRGTALANALAALELGITRFDTAVGGLGGSPFAPGAGGNLATEDLVLVLDDAGVRTGVHLDALLAIAERLPDLVGHAVPGRVAAAGALPRFGAR